MDVKCVKATEIEWKTGMNVTVEKVQKKVKGGGAKKAKQKKEKEEARPSFFREFFRNLEAGMKITDDIRNEAKELQGMDDDEDDDDDDDEILEAIMQRDHECGMALRDNVIPFAVRWYTGEAAPQDDDDDEDEEEEEEDETDEDESSEEAPKGKGKGKGKGSKKKTSPKSSPEMKPSGQPKEECKQQ